MNGVLLKLIFYFTVVLLLLGDRTYLGGQRAPGKIMDSQKQQLCASNANFFQTDPPSERKQPHKTAHGAVWI